MYNSGHEGKEVQQVTYHNVTTAVLSDQSWPMHTISLPGPNGWRTATPPIPRGKTTNSIFSSSRQFQEALLTTGQACQRLWDSPCLTPSSWRAISRHSSWSGPRQCRLLCLERGFLLQGDKEDSRSSGWFDFAGGIDRVKLAGLLGCGSILHAAVGRTRKQQSPASFQPLKCHSKEMGRARHGRAVLPLNQLQAAPVRKGLMADAASHRQ